MNRTSAHAGASTFLSEVSIPRLSGRVATAGAVAAAVVLVIGQPAEIKALGIVIGMLYALLAIGFVLVYRATRVLNMAHGDIGGFAALLLISIVFNLGWNYWLALGAAVATGIAVAALVETAFVNRLRDAPRVVLLIVTLGIAALIPTLSSMIISRSQQAQLLSSSTYPEPFSWSVTIFGAHLRPSALLTLILVPLVTLALAAFLRFHRFGVAMRAASENQDNARLLGVSVRRVSLAAWMIAGGLSALSAVLIGGASGTSLELGVGPGLLLRALAAAMLARLVSLPMTALWGLAIGVVEQAALFEFGGLRSISATGLVDALLLALILVTLLNQRRSIGRAGELDQSSWPVTELLQTIGRRALESAANRRLRKGVILAAISVVVLAPFVLSNAHIFAMTEVAAFAIAGVSLVVITGYGGQVSLGQWAVAGFGGLLAARVDTAWGWSPWASLLVAALVGGITALAIGVPALRLRGLFLAITTLAFAVAANGFLFSATWFTGSGEGSRVARPELIGGDRAFYFAASLLAAGMMLLARQAGRGQLGRRITAVRENERTAAAMGINLVATKLTTFALSGVIAGVAGWVFVYAQGGASAESFEPKTSFTLVALAVVGGLGSIVGPVLGALVVIGVPRLLPGQAFLAVIGTNIGMLNILLYLPGGLVSLPIRLRDHLLRSFADVDDDGDAPPEGSTESRPPLELDAREPVG